MLNVLVVGPESLSGELGPTALGRPDIERIHVEKAADALEAARHWRAALVVIDLPPVEAAALVRRFRSQGPLRHCAVVWLDRGSPPSDAEVVRQAGVNEVVPAPIDPLRWDRRLEELVTVPARVSHRTAVAVHDASQLLRGVDEADATLVNIGARGVLLESACELELGSMLGLTFALPGADEPLVLVGQVVRKVPSDQGLHRAGIEFLVYRGDARQRIAAFVAAGLGQPAEGMPAIARPFGSREWEEELRSSEVRKALVLDAAPDAIVGLDHEGRVTEWNGAARRLFGFTRAEAVGRHVAELVVPPAARQRFGELLQRLAQDGELPFDDTFAEVTAQRADGTEVPVEVSVSPAWVRGHLLVTGFLRDISRRRRQERLARARHEATRLLTASLPVAEVAPAVLRTLAEGLECDQAHLWLLEADQERLRLAASWPAVVPADDHLARQALEISLPSWEEGTAPGSALAVPVRVSGRSLGAIEVRRSRGGREADWLSPAGEVAGELGLFLERQRAEAELRRLARNDGLTGLPGRAYFLETLQRSVARASRQAGRLAVVFVDLDGFKSVNDSLGHADGDTVLRVMAERLREGTRSADVVARIGGDEFVVLVQGLSRPDDAAGVARTLLERLAAPCVVDRQQLRLGASAGIAVFPEDGQDADTLLRHADLAMYRAKQEGRNTYRFFAAEMGARAAERQELLVGLRTAIDRHEIELVYLPAMCGSRVVSMEALARWRRPGGGLLSPASFLDDAEESGLVVELGGSVLRTAARLAAFWRDFSVRLVVNVSARQIRDPHLFETVRHAVAVSALPPSRLEIDLPASAAAGQDEETRARLERLHRLGVRLALDGFGSTAFSPGRLGELGVSVVKLDRGLVAQVPGSPEAVRLVEGLLAMSRALGLEVVARGIESEAQREFFEGRGVDALQGFLFGQPLLAGEVAAFLARRRP